MTRFALAILVATLPALAADPPKVKPEDAKAAAKKVAEEIGAAMVKGDSSTLADGMFEPALKAMGGRKAIEKWMKDEREQMQASGMSFKSHSVGDPGELYSEGDYTFVIVPNTIEVSFAGGRGTQEEHLLGISSDAGKTWKFVDVSGVQDKKLRDKLLPKLPAKLELPERKPPKIVKEK
jgi:hypothetical protein